MATSMNMVSPLVCHPMGGRHPITAQGTPPRCFDVVPPDGRAHCARHTAANVHSLDGYTCQGTPSLMDEPQMKPCTSLGGSSWPPRHLSTPLDTSTPPRHLDTCSTPRHLSTPLDTVTALRRCQGCQGVNSTPRHLDTSTPLDTSTAEAGAST